MTTITAQQLNQIADLIGCNDRQVVISVAMKTLIGAGFTAADAFDAVFGEGAHTKFAGKLYDALQSA